VFEWSDVLSTFNRPQKPLELYEFEGCPFCRKVRQKDAASSILHPVHGIPSAAPASACFLGLAAAMLEHMLAKRTAYSAWQGPNVQGPSCPPPPPAADPFK